MLKTFKRTRTPKAPDFGTLPTFAPLPDLPTSPVAGVLGDPAVVAALAEERNVRDRLAQAVARADRLDAQAAELERELDALAEAVLDDDAKAVKKSAKLSRQAHELRVEAGQVRTAAPRAFTDRGILAAKAVREATAQAGRRFCGDTWRFREMAEVEEAALVARLKALRDFRDRAAAVEGQVGTLRVADPVDTRSGQVGDVLEEIRKGVSGAWWPMEETERILRPLVAIQAANPGSRIGVELRLHHETRRIFLDIKNTERLRPADHAAAQKHAAEVAEGNARAARESTPPVGPRARPALA